MKSFLSYLLNGASEAPKEATQPTRSRKEIHFPRRFFHMMNGLVFILLYQFLFEDKSSLVTFMGITASLLFISEQIRIKYPEYGGVFSQLNGFLYRAEERFEIASAMPYVVSCLLVVFIFPKPIAVITILFLAVGDPLSAIIGIKYGKHKISSNRSFEGSFAFFTVAFLACFLVMASHESEWGKIFLFAIFGGAIGVTADLIETRLDDNITIPLISAPLLMIVYWIIF